MIPTISVILPFHNSADYLREAIESILCQTLTDFELLAIDDHSSDRGPRIVEELAARDRRVKLLRSGGRGIVAALNSGIEAAGGKYVARMDGDDVSMPERFRMQVAALDRDMQVLAVGSAIECIDTKGRLIDVNYFPCAPRHIAEVLRQGVCCLCHPATMIRREALLAIGGYRDFARHAEDFDLWLRLSSIGELKNLDVPLLRFRLHRKSTSFRFLQAQVRAALRVALVERAEANGAATDGITNCDDLHALFAAWQKGPAPERAFLDLCAWYVDRAAVVGADRVARQLSAALANLSPVGGERWIRRMLLQRALVGAVSQGRTFAALRYAWSAGASLRQWAELTPRVSVSPSAPPGTAGEGGYIDHIILCEGRRVLEVGGWCPIVAGKMPKEVRLQIPFPAKDLRFLPQARSDVAAALGDDHFLSGYRIRATSADQLDIGVIAATQVWWRDSKGHWSGCLPASGVHSRAVEDWQSVSYGQGTSGELLPRSGGVASLT
jgi:GT2 family glycosyltransferase